MEFGTTLIGIICLAICAMPFVLTSRNRKKIIKTQLLALNNLAKQHNGEITQHDIYSYYAIGVDMNKNLLLFISNTDEDTKQQSINLKDIKSCDIVNISRSKVKGRKEIDELYLKLTPIDKTKEALCLEFFNTDVNYQLSQELQSINKWNTIINNILKPKS